jgi:hypothetical protein
VLAPVQVEALAPGFRSEVKYGTEAQYRGFRAVATAVITAPESLF